jgi:hypothetical protein
MPGRYRVLASGLVTFEGLLSNATAQSGGSIIANLPARVRPSQNLMFVLPIATGTGRFDINNVGNLSFTEAYGAGVAAPYTSLTGINYFPG